MPSASMPSTSTSGPPIMKSVCTVESLQPRSHQLVVGHAVAAVDAASRSRRRRRCGRRRSRRRACRRRRCRSGRRASRRRRATTSPRYEPPSSVLISSRTTSAPVVAVTSMTRPASKRIARSRTICPFDDERHRRADDALGAEAVRRREDLLGRHVDHHLDARRSSCSEPDVQRDCGISPTKRSVPGPRKRTPSKARSLRMRSRAPELRDVRAPGGDGVVLVESGRDRDGVPEPLDVRARRTPPRPSRRSDSRRSSTRSRRRRSPSASSRRRAGAAPWRCGPGRGRRRAPARGRP